MYNLSQNYCSKFTPELQVLDLGVKDMKNHNNRAQIFTKVRELCRERGVSIRCVEQTAGLGFRSISNWNASSPSVENLKAVADYFGVTVDELIREDV